MQILLGSIHRVPKVRRNPSLVIFLTSRRQASGQENVDKGKFSDLHSVNL